MPKIKRKQNCQICHFTPLQILSYLVLEAALETQ